MKRLKARLIREFNDWSVKFRYRGLKFRYDDLYTVQLSWNIHIGRELYVRSNLSDLAEKYELSRFPVKYLKASIKIFQRIYNEEIKR